MTVVMTVRENTIKTVSVALRKSVVGLQSE